MAYPMSRAVPGSETVPLPTSPVVWAGYALKTLRACIMVGLLWAMAVAMLGFFSPLKLVHVFDDIPHFVPALLFVIGLVGALGLGNEIGKDFKHVLGFGVIKRTSDFQGHTVAPRRGRRLTYASVFSGLFLGLVAAAAIRAWHQDWLGFLLLSVVAIVLVVPTIKTVRLAAIMWGKALALAKVHADIVRDGEHSVGVVTSVTNEEFIVDDRAMFHVDLEYQTGGRTETTRIRFFDYPVWAPAVGNEFDVWSDPERPFVQDRILVERRYVGQEFVNLADEPVAGIHVPADELSDDERGEAAEREAAERETAERKSEGSTSGSVAGANSEIASDSDSEGKEAGLRRIPQWMADEAHEPATPAIARRTRFLIGIPPNLIALMALLGTLLVPSMVEDVPWWTLASLWIYTVLTIINAAVYWQFMLRQRWFIRSGVSFGATEAAVFGGFFAAGFAMLTTHNLVMAPLNREIPWTTAHVLTWAAVIGALLVFEWAFTSNAWALRHLNAEFPAPPEVIQEALINHDPDGIDKLEEDYGYRAGVFLCP